MFLAISRCEPMPDLKPEANTDDLPTKNLVLANNINVGRDLVLTSPSAPPPTLLPRRVKRKLPPLLPHFVGRESTLDEIARYFSDSLGPGVISDWIINGQGGIGKTTLASQYAWTHDVDYPGGIFMVDCSTEDFAIAMADLFPIIFDTTDDSYVDLQTSARHITDYLSSSNKRFLLILDNVNSVKHWHQLRDSGYLPTGSYDCLITTTASDIPSLRSRLLERLTTADGINLLTAFRDDIHSDENRTTVGSLVEWFGGVPFYLSVLGMYMKRSPRLSWQSYAASLEQQGLTAVRATEDAAGPLPDRYARKIDQVLDNLFNSLNENERRTLEYAVLLFPGEINGYALLNILTYDVNMQFRPMPGYAFPARHLLERLEDDQILTARGEGNNKVFSIHQIMRRKLVERISADAAHKTNLLRQVYKAAVNRICSGDQLISCDDSAPTWPPIGIYYHSMHSIFRALEECGFIPTEVGLYNHWIVFADRMGTARRLASRLGGRVDIQMNPVSATHMHQFPLVVVEQADYAQACAFRTTHGGHVKQIYDPSKNNTSFYVVIPINS
jgi:NB-ARC domain